MWRYFLTQNKRLVIDILILLVVGLCALLYYFFGGLGIGSSTVRQLTEEEKLEVLAKLNTPDTTSVPLSEKVEAIETIESTNTLSEEEKLDIMRSLNTR